MWTRELHIEGRHDVPRFITLLCDNYLLMIINFKIQDHGHETKDDLQSWILWPQFMLCKDEPNDGQVVVSLMFDHNSLIVR